MSAHDELREPICRAMSKCPYPRRIGCHAIENGTPCFGLSLEGKRLAEMILALPAIRDAQAQVARLTAERDAIRAAALEEAAKVARSEKLYGVVPCDFSVRDIHVAEATVRATAKSIADKIEALIPAKEGGAS
jgi:hypothetical protein